MNKIKVEQVDNGYIVTNNINCKTICNDIIDVFNELMLIFKGKSEHFHSDLYAKIKVDYNEPEYFDSLDMS